MTTRSPSASLSSPDGGVEHKNATQVLEQEQPPEAVDAYQNPWHTVFDRTDMQRLGKKQEYRRVFGPLATFGFISMYLCTWEYILVSVSGGLINGGFGGLVWEYIFTAFAFGSVVITMAEMTSMAPTSVRLLQPIVSSFKKIGSTERPSRCSRAPLERIKLT